ncbi:YHYH protein [Algoriphagus chordae]|uniref:YHYH protein n=1 Tax=Algoriphagus chordae TaxID=237019 RepID=A0A2W7R432_9BACT|nr:YHYH protein [Algoriphagus chordae]PZX50617.1 YHYH protein [Algoriphagus chordae]
MKTIRFSLLMIFGICTWMACGSTSEENVPGNLVTELPAAFSDFDDENTTIYLDGQEIVIESNGMPNHKSPYWSSTHERSIVGPNGEGTMVTEAAEVDHPLFVEPTVTSYDQMAPGNIDNFNGSYTLRIPAAPTKASSTSSTGLGPIGIAVSGAMIYNDEEGPNIPLDGAVSSLDFNGAHTGPQSYHYHLEPKSFSDDDDNLIGVISDGFLLYGRKCASSDTYPVDLDASGGHTSATKHSTEELYHYHTQNELYLNKYYILFPGNYQGSSNAIY